MNAEAVLVEPFVTIEQAASQLGVHVWALRRAIKRGEVPAYLAFNGRKRVRLSEVIAVIEDSANAGGFDE